MKSYYVKTIALLILLVLGVLPYAAHPGAFNSEDYNCWSVYGPPSAMNIHRVFAPILFGYVRPAFILYWRMMLDAFGMTYQPFFIAALILHAVNIVLIFALSMRLWKSVASAFLGTLLFLLFSHASAIAFPGANSQLIETGMSVASIIAWISWREHGSIGYYTVAILCGALAMATKEDAYTLPVIIVLLNTYLLKARVRETAWASSPLFACLLLLVYLHIGASASRTPIHQDIVMNAVNTAAFLCSGILAGIARFPYTEVGNTGAIYALPFAALLFAMRKHIENDPRVVFVFASTILVSLPFCATGWTTQDWYYYPISAFFGIGFGRLVIASLQSTTSLVRLHVRSRNVSSHPAYERRLRGRS